MLKSVNYVAPSWTRSLGKPPSKRFRVGNFPTPIFPFKPPGLPSDVSMFIKRDDFSGLEMSGNKVRKLEFLMQEAIDHGADCVVTSGGIQSNHCRATAAFARMLGMDPVLLLRTNQPEVDPGMTGNLLVDRLMGAKVVQVSRKEYAQLGSEALIQHTCDKLQSANRRPYAIPVGGSNGLGTWGYIEAINELITQLKECELKVSDLAFACGSGGTAAGLGLGSYLYSKDKLDSFLDFNSSPQTPPVHAYGVCDSPEYFFNHIDTIILPQMGADALLSSRSFLQLSNAQGMGYARNTRQELDFIRQVAQETGVILDPVYSGKALFHLTKELHDHPNMFVGKSILFVHTGGLLGLFDKSSELEKLLATDQVQRFSIDAC